jgi:deoxyribodipyrimidine photo-lyase
MKEDSRIQRLNSNDTQKGAYVIYWMQASQRTEYNHALEYAIEQANDLKQPLIAYFGLTAAFPEANERHYRFMLEGLNETRIKLKDRGIGMVIEQVSPESGVTGMARNASLVVCDRGYLKIQKQWRMYAAVNMRCPLIQVESDVVVPVEVASNKEEYSASTMRRKLMHILPRYLVTLVEQTPKIDSTRQQFKSYDITDISAVTSKMDIDHIVKPVTGFVGGTAEAKKRLELFMRSKLDKYSDFRNDPNQDRLSNLSPYLHFGQISSLYIALQVLKQRQTGVDAFLEELIVRRELSMNFVHYNSSYDSFNGLPGWVKKTLSDHMEDSRNYIYSIEELEQARTHDSYWNAAQKEMVNKGKMHGYMRMYWGKKILEWVKDPERAHQLALRLNNKYELDGRDPNGFAGVAWCFGKHDRPWGRRPIFGNVRYMSADGLKRKFDVDKYVRAHSR